MRLHVVLCVVTAFFGSCALEKNEEAGLIHHLTKRQTAEELGPIPYIAREQYAPLPYQQSQADSSSGSTAAEHAASSDGGHNAHASRDYHSSGGSSGSYYNVDSGRAEDWVASSNLGHSSSSSSSSSSSQTRYPSSQSQSSQISGSSSQESSSSRGRPYYQYQPPISSGPRSASHGQFHVSGRSSQSGQSQPQLSSQDQNQVPTQSHVAGVTRYVYNQPSASRGSRRQSNSRTYTYPFSGGRNIGHSQVAIQGSSAAVAGEGGGVRGGEGVESHGAGGGNRASSVNGDEEPVVQILPSERPVVNPQASQQQQLLRQRELERQRRLQQLRQQQAAISNAQRRPSSSSSSSGGQQQRPIYTGSQSLGGNYGQPTYHGGQQQGQQNRQVYGGRQPVYGGQGQRIYGGRRQQPYYGSPQGGVNQGDYDSECPNTGIRIQINGIPCEQAVDHYGSYLCYRHEYTSRECCLRCRGLKNPARVGCEYGDHSGRCQQLQPYDCYDLRNRQSCCQSCERMRIAGARSGCEYGDMTPNCEQVRQNPGLCYIPENRYLCCQTCSTVRVTEDPECPWGDQNADLCQPFDRVGNIRINCYAPPIKRICCQACRRLEDWIPMNQPGCEYGDRPVTFNTGMHRNLNCTTFVRYYGYEQCNLNQAVATNCCYTCHRYTRG